MATPEKDQDKSARLFARARADAGRRELAGACLSRRRRNAALHPERQRPNHHRCRWPDVHRLRRLVGPDDSGPCRCGNCRRAGGRRRASGTSFGAPNELEIELAEEIVAAVPSIEMVRMVNSGTEATMSAIRLARGVTGRDKLVKFEGCYHGHADSLLVKAGSGVATLGLPDSPGVPASLAQHTLTVPFNDPTALETVFKQHDRHRGGNHRTRGRKYGLRSAAAWLPGKPARFNNKTRRAADLR